MGTDAHLSLPPGTRVGDVASVLGAAFGLARGMEPLNHNVGNAYFKVPGAEVEAIKEVPTMLWITLKGPGRDDPVIGIDPAVRVAALDQSGVIVWRDRRAHWHYENDYGEVAGSPLLTAPSTPHWIVAMRRAGEFFGGVLDWNDCDAERANEVWPAVAEHRPFQDHDAWQKLQDDMAEVRPMEQDEIVEARLHAAYKSR